MHYQQYETETELHSSLMKFSAPNGRHIEDDVYSDDDEEVQKQNVKLLTRSQHESKR